MLLCVTLCVTQCPKTVKILAVKWLIISFFFKYQVICTNLPPPVAAVVSAAGLSSFDPEANKNNTKKV